MAISKEDLLKLVNLKQEVFKVSSWNSEVEVRELTIAESKVYNQMRIEEKSIEEIVKYACKCSMVNPQMFTDEELSNAGQIAVDGLNEIFSNIPVIGKTKEQKEEFYKKQLETFKASSVELTKEEEEKK